MSKIIGFNSDEAVTLRLGTKELVRLETPGVAPGPVTLPRIGGTPRSGLVLWADTSDLPGTVTDYAWTLNGGLQGVGPTLEVPNLTGPQIMAGQVIGLTVTTDQGAFTAPARAIRMTHGSVEHTAMDDAADDLAPHTQLDAARPGATIMSIRDGDWAQAGTWDQGRIPVTGDRVLIRTQDEVTAPPNCPRLDWLRIDGTLLCPAVASWTLFAETVLVGYRGTLGGQTETARQAAGTLGRIQISGRDVTTSPGADSFLNLARDPKLLGRGVVSLGAVTLFGRQRTEYSRTVGYPLAGATSLTLQDVPADWSVGDTICVVGTVYDVIGATAGSKYGTAAPQDETVQITAIDGADVTFSPALQFDHGPHTTTAEGLAIAGTPHVAHLDRNICVESEVKSDARYAGHFMVMHEGSHCDIAHVKFDLRGRTRKDIPAGVINDSGSFVAFDYVTKAPVQMTEWDSIANIQGRYGGPHLHQTNPQALQKVYGCVVLNANGWGYVHHEGHAVFARNICSGFVGAGMVAETGNETGWWLHNLSFGHFGPLATIALPKDSNTDLGGSYGDPFRQGCAFAWRGRAVIQVGNAAASCYAANMFWHRENESQQFAATKDVDRTRVSMNDIGWPAGMGTGTDVYFKNWPILNFSKNEAYGCKVPFFVSKEQGTQFHGVQINIEDFTAWATYSGIALEYIQNYAMRRVKSVSTDFVAQSPMIGPRFVFSTANSSWVNLIDCAFDGGEGIKIESSAKANNTSDDYDGADNPRFILSDVSITNFIATDESENEYQAGRSRRVEAGVTYETELVDGMVNRCFDVVKHYATTPANTGAPQLTGQGGIGPWPLVWADWDGANSITNFVIGAMSDCVGMKVLPTATDAQGLPDFRMGKSQLIAASAEFGRYGFGGQVVTRWPFYITERIHGVLRRSWVGVAQTGALKGDDNGVLDVTTVPPTDADLVAPHTGAGPVTLDIAAAVTVEPGATKTLASAHLPMKYHTAEFNGDGSVTLTPLPGFEGFPDRSQFFVDDGRTASATVTVSIPAASG